MATWLIVTLSVYALVVIAFFIKMALEAPRHQAELGFVHALVALLWPIWLVWYCWILYRD